MDLSVRERPQRKRKAPNSFMKPETLISAVAKKPVLWDKSYPLYKDKVATAQAWTDISKEFISSSRE